MKTFNKSITAGVLAGASFLALSAVPIYALGSSAGVQTPANQSDRLANIKSKGDSEISRRLSSLGKLNSKINSAVKLSASDKTTLQTEVNNEISGLTALKTKLDNETTADAAATDAKSIFSEYRVYALVTPKVWLVKTADDQQVTEGKLSALAGKLQTRINTAKSQGKDVTSLQSTLDDMTAKTSAAQAISSAMESKVIGLQPSDYNSDHSLLSGDRDQLQAAHGDNQQAFSDAKTIVAGMKNL